MNDQNSIQQSLANYKSILASMIVIGSNVNANDNLKKGYELLSQLSFVKQITLINSHISQDYKNLSSTLYHNQGFLIEFNTEVNYSIFNYQLKHIEKLCGRNHNDDTLVSLDMDILKIYCENAWYVIFERLPFKEHELICLNHQFKDCL